MKLAASAIQMQSEPFQVAANLERADAALREARDLGVELAVLPEMFNTGYGFVPDYEPVAEGPDGPSLRLLRERSRSWGMVIAGGFVERDGHHLYDSLAVATPEGTLGIYRKRNLVFWERFRFRPGRDPVVVATRWGRIGLAICADMIYRRVWSGYSGRIDLGVVSAAWPDFACRHTGRKHWLLGHVGPLSAELPGKVALDMGIPVVFSNQCGPTQSFIPVLRTRIADRFAGQSSVCDGRHGSPVRAGVEPAIVTSTVTLHPARGPISCHIMSRSAHEASSSASARS